MNAEGKRHKIGGCKYPRTFVILTSRITVTQHAHLHVYEGTSEKCCPLIENNVQQTNTGIFYVNFSLLSDCTRVSLCCLWLLSIYKKKSTTSPFKYITNRGNMNAFLYFFKNLIYINFI